MVKIDLDNLGLKCGLEIHQQLDTRKLFCDCYSVLRKDTPDYEIKRKLSAVAGESGEIDIAVKYQSSLGKEFIYQGYDSICLVELDEEPPHNINKEALKIAIQIVILFNAKIIPLTQIMRKTVIDGSNTSGFQRTVMIGRDGYIDTSKGRIKIDSICLEEDSARIIEKRNNNTVYRLDRLGIPLVEITTAPDIKTPEHAKEVALIIGNILRSCKIKRGIGTIRQDVNVSINKGNRTELKGFQDIKTIGLSIEKEIKRQLNLINENKYIEGSVRNVLDNGESKFLRPLPGSARMYPETDLPLLKISKNLILKAKKELPKLIKDIENELFKKGLNKEMVNLLFKEKRINDFKLLLKVYNNPKVVINTLLTYPKEISKHKKISLDKINEILNDDILFSILDNVNKKNLSEANIKIVLERLIQGLNLDEAIIFNKKNDEELEELIMKMIKEKPGLSENAYMGLIMKNQKIREVFDGRKIRKIIKKFSL
jgi:Glu-tRNA(Gln) amidotransferase subunit E-like FAD-binding protein